MKTLLKALMLTLLTANSYGAGFRLSEQSAKANGMGNSFVAVADDASAVWYNPAAMTELEKTQFSLGTVMIYPLMKHEYTGGDDTIAKRLHTPPQFYATHKYSDKFAFGFGVNAPFGLQTNWGVNAQADAVATLSDIKAFNYNLNAAYKASEKLSLGAGIDYMSVEATLNSYPGMAVEMTGDGAGYGYNLAAFYKLSEKWNLGANYRSQVKIDMDGELLLITRKAASTTLTLPDTFQLGAAYKHNDKWLYSFTMDYTNWTTYRTLAIKTATSTTYNKKNWKSVWAYRLGTEYKYSDNLKLRGGIFYDKNPVEEKYFENRVPDSDRLAFSIGTGYAKGSWVFDFSYTYLHFMKREIDSSVQDDSYGNVLNGTYTAAAHLPGFSVSYKF